MVATYSTVSRTSPLCIDTRFRDSGHTSASEGAAASAALPPTPMPSAPPFDSGGDTAEVRWGDIMTEGTREAPDSSTLRRLRRRIDTEVS
jgi:hypothetical protein